MVKVTLSVSSLQKSLEYWNKLLGMKIMKQTDTSAELAYSDSQVLVCVCVCVGACMCVRACVTQCLRVVNPGNSILLAKLTCEMRLGCVCQLRVVVSVGIFHGCIPAEPLWNTVSLTLSNLHKVQNSCFNSYHMERVCLCMHV